MSGRGAGSRFAFFLCAPEDIQWIEVRFVPLYEYQCKNCGHTFEKIQSFSAPEEKECPKCGGPVEKLLSAPAVQFKGTGWYVTDYAGKGGSKKSGSSDGAKSGEGASSDKPAASGDSSSASSSTPAPSASPAKGE
jgi:putative FmdB family regulatory protein